MTERDNILQELNELKSSLAGSVPQNIYSVPVGYFDSLAGNVLTRIKAMEAANAADELAYLSPLLSAASKQLPYTVPSGYFEGLEKSLMEKVQESNDYQTSTEELATISPFLNGLKKEMPFSVPQGYFDNLSETVTKVSTRTETKVISLTSRKWFRYAAAAVIVGIISMAGFMFLNKEKVDPETNSYGWVKKNTKKVSTENIDKFVELTEEENLVASTDTKVPVDLKELIKDVPEKEIQNLLNDTQLLDDASTEPASDDETLMN